MSINVFYAGMADDIMSPLLLVPDLSRIYAIDAFDPAFCKSNEWAGVGGMKEDIMNILVRGDDFTSYSRGIYMSPCGGTDSALEDLDVHDLAGPSSILENHEENNRWYLKFVYQGIERELIYFHHRNFHDVWPEEIAEIEHVFTMGVPFVLKRVPMLTKMLDSRMAEYFTYWALHYSHQQLKKKIKIKNARKRIGELIGYQTVKRGEYDRMKPDWEMVQSF